jgi:GT2 family glycosyltransferase
MTILVRCKILHIDLAVDIPSINRDSTYGRVLVIFWWRGIPLGRRDFGSTELPLDPGAVAVAARIAMAPAVLALLSGTVQRPLERQRDGSYERSISPIPSLDFLLQLQAPLALLEERHRVCSSSSRRHRVSLVICTRDRTDQLVRCLGSILPELHHFHEVLIVDNGSDHRATRRAISGIPGILCLHEPKPGLSAARNAGVRHSSGEIIAFTDDDVLVHTDWAARVSRAFEDPKVMCVTGRIFPLSLDTPAEIAFEVVFGWLGHGFMPLVFDEEYFRSTRPRGCAVWQIGAGANMAIRRTAFNLVGLFDERLGAGAAGCSEDSEFWYRLLAAGFVCRYDPLAVVFHQHRREWHELEDQAYHYMRGHVAALIVQYQKHHHWGNAYRLAIVLPAHFVMLIVKTVLRGRSLRERLVWPRIRGSLAGLFALRRGIAT